MRRFVLAVSAFAMVWSAPRAAAQVLTATTTVYSAVDAFSVKGVLLTVTGVVQGDSAPTTKNFQIVNSSTSANYPFTNAVLENCSRSAALAMAKPGAYLLEVAPLASTLNLNLTGCSLARVTP